MRKLIIILLVLVTVFVGFSLSAIQCKPPKQEFKGKCYYQNDLKKAKVTWRKKQAARRKRARKKYEEEKYRHFPLKHAGLHWSEKTPKEMNWTDAKNYCEDLGGRLPTISELRILIKNCPKTETGGSCGVTDSCLSPSCLNDTCEGCSSDKGKSGKYSVWGDTGWFWSSSALSGLTDNVWALSFYYGDVYNDYLSYKGNVRCVKD